MLIKNSEAIRAYLQNLLFDFVGRVVNANLNLGATALQCTSFCKLYASLIDDLQY